MESPTQSPKINAKLKWYRANREKCMAARRALYYKTPRPPFPRPRTTCPHCDKSLAEAYLKRHIIRKHPDQSAKSTD